MNGLIVYSMKCQIKREKCSSLFPKVQCDALKLLLLSKQPKTQRLLIYLHKRHIKAANPHIWGAKPANFLLIYLKTDITKINTATLSFLVAMQKTVTLPMKPVSIMHCNKLWACITHYNIINTLIMHYMRLWWWLQLWLFSTTGEL